MINFRKIGLVGAVAASVLLLSACSAYKPTTTGSPNSGAGAPSSTTTSDVSAAVVTYSDSGFSPATVNAKVGQKVVFKNMSSNAVQVNSDPHPVHSLYPELNIGMVAAGSEGSTTFAKAGTYTYHNHLNASQVGTIVVQ
jgi:plastocyanin